jgi:hypothetical protein
MFRKSERCLGCRFKVGYVTLCDPDRSPNPTMHRVLTCLDLLDVPNFTSFSTLNLLVIHLSSQTSEPLQCRSPTWSPRPDTPRLRTTRTRTTSSRSTSSSGKELESCEIDPSSVLPSLKVHQHLNLRQKRMAGDVNNIVSAFSF